jgi:hypothetical protein
MTLVPAAGTLHKSLPFQGAQDLTNTLRYLAGLKNVPLTPEQISGAVSWAEKCLHDPQMPFVDLGNAPISDPATKVVDRIVDVLAARQVLHHVAVLIEGNVSPDPETLLKRADESVNRFTGGVPFFRWPDPMETLRLHYANVPWAPVVIKLDDGSVTTSYFCNDILHRDPAQGPAWHRKSVHGEALQYIVRGKLHRDPAEGPALGNINIDGSGITSEEYYVEGRLHRPASDGPAITVKNQSEQVTFTAYMENGQLHRNPGDGPAVLVHSYSGEVIEQEYWVEGEKIDMPSASTGNRAARRKSKSRKRKASRPANQLVMAEACDG